MAYNDGLIVKVPTVKAIPAGLYYLNHMGVLDSGYPQHTQFES